MNSVDLEDYYQDLSSILPKLGLNDNQVSELVNRYGDDIHMGVYLFELDNCYLISFTCFYCEDSANVTISVKKGEMVIEYEVYEGYEIKQINDRLFVFQKTNSLYISNAENRDYYRIYNIIEEQGLINSKGEVIFKGDLGDVTKIQENNGYLILEKDKYTEQQQDQIRYYINNCMSHASDVKFHERLDFLAAIDFEKVFKSKKVTNGKYLTTTLEEENLDYKGYYEELFGEDFYYEDDETDQYTKVKLYCIFDLNSKSILFPFQPYKIQIDSIRRIYFIIDDDILQKSFKIKYNPHIVNDSYSKFSVGSDKTCYYSGQFFNSTCDTFRSGPYIGYSLRALFKEKPNTIIKYVLNHDIYITNNALNQLGKLYKNSHKKTYYKLIAARDKDLHDGILFSSKDKIGSKYVCYGKFDCEKSYFENISLNKLFAIAPLYLVYTLEMNIYFIHPDALAGLENLPNFELLSNMVDIVYQDRLAIEEERKMRDEYREWEESQRMEIETGWKTAFGDDPESEWNID